MFRPDGGMCLTFLPLSFSLRRGHFIQQDMEELGQGSRLGHHVRMLARVGRTGHMDATEFACRKSTSDY